MNKIILYQTSWIEHSEQSSAPVAQLFTKKNPALRLARRVNGRVMRLVVAVKHVTAELLRPDEMPDWWWDTVIQEQGAKSK